MLSGAALIVIGATAALAVNRTRSRDTVSSPVGDHTRANPFRRRDPRERSHLSHLGAP
jgi:hypothetical protein